MLSTYPGGDRHNTVSIAYIRFVGVSHAIALYSCVCVFRVCPYSYYHCCFLVARFNIVGQLDV